MRPKGKTAKALPLRRGKAAPLPPAKVRQEHSAGFILVRQVEGTWLFLLLDYGKHWDYPKGHLEDGETSWKAAVRELREETGIRQVDRCGRFQMDMHYQFYSPRKGRIEKTVTYFLGRTKTQEVSISDEHVGYAWLEFEPAMARLTYQNARDLLAAAWKELTAQR